MPEPIPFPAPILRAVALVTVSATAEPFVARDWFERPPGVRISMVWNEFKRRFYPKAEEPFHETTFRKYDLLVPSPDGPIIAQLGGEDRADTPLGAMAALIRNQGRGQTGILQTNGYANIFYIRDTNGTLCAVRLGWVDDGWVVDAIAVADPLAWNGSHAIFWPEARS
jgi:hypothetical protein